MDQVGRYQIAGELGRGAMGVVYKALDPAIGRTVAIKTIHLTDLTDAGARQRFREQLLREAQAAGTLSHPNIVTVFDVLEQADFAFVVMEYVAGRSLDEMLRAQQLPGHEKLLIFLRQVAEALDYAHRKGIVHRDVKPANIIISDLGGGGDPIAKIADFGVARVVSSDATHSGSFTGTPSYMSPEQIQGLTIDGRSDQFSLAAVVYELLSGEKPFAADTLPALLHSIAAADPKPIEEVNPALSETVGKVMRRALAKKPEDRFASCSDFVGALSIALAESQDWQTLAGADKGLWNSAAVAGARASAASSTAEAATRRRTRKGEQASAAHEERSRAPATTKLALIVVLCFAVAATIMFIVRMNSGPQIPVQVLDTGSGLGAVPPPASVVAGNRKRTAGGSQITGTQSSSTPPQRQSPTSPPVPVMPPANPSTKSTNEIARKPAPRTPANGESIPSGPAAGSVADIDLLSEPPGAKIVVDSRPDAVCTAPCTMSLPVGRHTLTAQLDGYAVARRIFNIPGLSSLFIPLAQNQSVLVFTSTPSGSTIFVDGKLYGQTPATLHLTPGVHHFTLMNGSQQRQETLNIEPESFQVRSIRW